MLPAARCAVCARAHALSASVNWPIICAEVASRSTSRAASAVARSISERRAYAASHCWRSYSSHARASAPSALLIGPRAGRRARPRECSALFAAVPEPLARFLRSTLAQHAREQRWIHAAPQQSARQARASARREELIGRLVRADHRNGGAQRPEAQPGWTKIDRRNATKNASLGDAGASARGARLLFVAHRQLLPMFRNSGSIILLPKYGHVRRMPRVYLLLRVAPV